MQTDQPYGITQSRNMVAQA